MVGTRSSQELYISIVPDVLPKFDDIPSDKKRKSNDDNGGTRWIDLVYVKEECAKRRGPDNQPLQPFSYGPFIMESDESLESKVRARVLINMAGNLRMQLEATETPEVEGSWRCVFEVESLAELDGRRVRIDCTTSRGIEITNLGQALPDTESMAHTAAAAATLAAIANQPPQLESGPAKNRRERLEARKAREAQQQQARLRNATLHQQPPMAITAVADRSEDAVEETPAKKRRTGRN